jgi:hypothetical protein
MTLRACAIAYEYLPRYKTERLCGLNWRLFGLLRTWSYVGPSGDYAAWCSHDTVSNRYQATAVLSNAISARYQVAKVSENARPWGVRGGV